MNMLQKKYLTFFIVVLIASPLFGIFLMKEEISSLLVARAFFTACLSTVIYFLINRRSTK